MKISFSCDVMTKAVKNTKNIRLNSRGKDNQPLEAKKIERLYDRMSKIRERINEVKVDEFMPDEAKKEEIKQLTESLHAAQLEIEFLSRELRKKNNAEGGLALNMMVKPEKNRDVFECAATELDCDVKGVMERFLEKKKAEEAKRTEEQEKQEEQEKAQAAQDEEEENCDYVPPAAGGSHKLENAVAASAGLDEMETIMAATRKLERTLSRREHAFLTSGGGKPSIDAILNMRAQIRTNMTNPLHGLLRR
jgi:hypothetical protein